LVGNTRPKAKALTDTSRPRPILRAGEAALGFDSSWKNPLPQAKAFGRENLPKNRQDNQLMRILHYPSVKVKRQIGRCWQEFRRILADTDFPLTVRVPVAPGSTGR
jgi:hypothetical protein